MHAYFPITETHPEMCQAADIAMGYVKAAGFENRIFNLECLVAAKVLEACAKACGTALPWQITASLP